jgi:putative transposase
VISVRYPDGGGLTAAQREKRERLRLEAAALFANGLEPPQVALRLRVSRNSAYRWRRAWAAGGTPALASKGPSGSPCRLNRRQLERLAAALEAGPALYGWDQDQRWTGARVATLIGRLFHVRYTVRGATYLLHRLGFSAQVPAHRAAERDDADVEAWRESTWPEIKG